MKPETPAAPETVARSAETKQTRRPYVAPAIDGSATIEPVTLGTKPMHAPGHGC
jgi:hypothetical protein